MLSAALTFALSVAGGTLLASALMKPIADLRVPMLEILWAVFLAHLLSGIINVAIGVILSSRPSLGLVLAIAIMLFLQAVLLRASVRLTKQTLGTVQAYLLAAAVLLLDLTLVPVAAGLIMRT